MTTPISTALLDNLIAPKSSSERLIKGCTCAPLGATPISTPLLDSLVAPFTLAERLGTTERSLSEWRITGRGPKFIRVGRSVRYRPEAVDTWLLSQEYASTSEEVR